MKRMFKANLDGTDTVTSELCVRETEKSVFVEFVGHYGGKKIVRRELKECTEHRYFHAFWDAKACVVEHIERKAEKAAEALKLCWLKLECAKVLTRADVGAESQSTGGSK